tara:strand:- start:160984 stop:161880 length:897 start_codon:yes stop_codon:yes gene_type:complete
MANSIIKKMKKSLGIVLILFIGSTNSFAGGGWTAKKGEGYFKLSQWWIISDQHFTDAGLIDPNVTSGIFNTSIYAEFGINDRFTAIGYIPFFSRATMNNQISATSNKIISEGDAINSFGDTDIGIKYGILKNKKIALAASLSFGLPLGNSSGGKNGNLQTGDGEFNQILKIDAGIPFGIAKIPAYANIYSGFNNRSNGFSDEYRYGAEFGMGLKNKKLWLIGRITGVESLRNGSLGTDINSTSVFANNSEFTSYSLEAAYYINQKIGVSASFASAFRGEIIFASPSYSIGVFMDLKKG